MATTGRIKEAHVARLFPPYEVVISAGAIDGVQLGALAIAHRPYDIKDPASGETLGTLRRAVLQMRVSDVQERFSVAYVQDWVEREREAGGVAAVFYGPQSENKRVTEELSNEDWRTVFIPAGAAVEVHLDDIVRG